ncbi:hypothetical protein R6Q59_003682 [Mikania micrantha]
MPQLHTSLHFHLTPIVMINGSSRRDLLLNSQNFCRSIPAGAENPSLSRLCYRRLWGSRNRRALILGWAYYLDAFSSYPLRTWLPSVYRNKLKSCITLLTRSGKKKWIINNVDDKIHGRSSGRYSRLTQQPLKGRAKKGGQRVGEMEVWALEGFGVAYILQEMLTYKSDHIRARQEVLGTIIFGGRIPTPEDAPESFRLFVRELRSLALELNHFLVSEKTFQLNRKEA